MKLPLKFEVPQDPSMPPRRLTSPITSSTPHHVHHVRELFARDLPTPIKISLPEFYAHIGASPAPIVAHKSRLLDFIKQANMYTQEMSPQSS